MIRPLVHGFSSIVLCVCLCWLPRDLAGQTVPAPGNNSGELQRLTAWLEKQQQIVERQQQQLAEQRRILDEQAVQLTKLTALLDRFSATGRPAADRGDQAGEDSPLRRGDAGSSDRASALVAAAPYAGEKPRADREEDHQSPDTFRAYWDEGLRFETANQDFQAHLVGRIMNDWGVFAPSREIQSAVGPMEDGTEFRRARLGLEGLMYQRVMFKAEYSFVRDEPFRDVYIGLKNLPLIGDLYFGHFKEPFGLEGLTSSRHITLMERGLTDAFSPERNIGVKITDALVNEQMTWSAGVFRNTDDFGFSRGNGGYNYTGRLTARPWHREEGRKLLHLGIAYTHSNPQGNEVQFESPPEANLSPNFVNTQRLPANAFDMVGAEFAVVVGPASLQSEYIFNSVDQTSQRRANLSSFYVQGSYFLTGESRAYDSGDAVFDRVRPFHSFGSEGKGGGAWEIAVRYSRLDLTDGLVRGGELQDLTLGLNWYLNPHTRFMWNYVLADRIDVGTANLFQTRFQVDF